MKKYLISGFNTVQDVKLEAGTYTLVAYAKSMYSNVYTFALGDGENWTEYDIDVVQGQLCKVWLTFTIDKKATKFKPIANNFTESLPVYVTDLQLTRGNIPVESGASPFDIDQILNDLHDEIDGIEDFTNEAFMDGLLSREEKTQLRSSLEAIGTIVESVKGSYDKLLDNPFISDATMNDITEKYYAFIASWISDGDPRGLKPVILWIVNGDHIVSQNEREEKDRALNAFNDALYAYNQAEKEVYNDVGENSIAPIIIDGFWAFWDKETETFIPSEFSAIGDDGHAPIIRDGYWYEWNPELEGEDKYENTGVRAEGVKGDGAIEKFKSSATQPSTPTGEAEDWDDEPTASQYATLEPVGNNLYGRDYLIQRGWTNYGGYVLKDLTSVGENLINPSLLKPNKQYILKGRIDGDPAGSFLDINYTTGSKKTIMMTPGTIINETTDKNSSVASIVVRQYWVTVFDGVTLFELDMGEVKNLPIWATRKTIKNGVESAWSTPVRWSGEDGEKGKDGTGINVVGSADTWNNLPTSGNNLNDARIVQDTGVLAVWDGTKWVGAGEIKGPAGDTPYIGGNGNWWIGGTDTGIKAKGEKGDKGEEGEKGDGVRILGSFNTPSELSGVSNPALGDGYMINGDLWVYVGGSIHTPPAPVGWNNVGRIKGDKGKDGSSYLVMGYWSPDYEYQISDAGIPVVKRPGSATFIAYKLIVPKSTPGQFINTDPNKEWELVDSSEFTYMLEAYIEVLQAELITAEKIEALDITARKLKTPSTVVTTANFQSQLIQANSVIIQDKGSIPVTYDWNTVYLPNGEQYDGLKAQIYAPTGTYKRIRIKTSDGGLLFINNTEVAVGKIELAFTTMATIHLTAMWNPTHSVLDWIITYYQVYRLSNAVQTDQKRLPVILWSGDSLFSGTIPKSGVLPTDSLGVLTTINSNWLRGFTCSKNSSNVYSIKINTPFHYGASSSVSPRQTITSGDIEVSINPSNTFSPINTYIAVYGQYEYTEIRVWFSNPSTPSTYIEQDFTITVRANRPIVQDEYLTSTID